MASTDWERYKATILNLYLLEQTPLHEVISYMQQEYNFVKKKAQYQYQLKKWGVRKKLSKDVWRHLGYQLQKRKGRRSEVTLFEIPLPEEKVLKEIQRYSAIPTASEFGKRLPSPKIPEGVIVRVRTPSIVEPDGLWPSNLPCFQFQNRVLPTLSYPSALSKALFAGFSSNESFSYYKGGNALYATARDPLEFGKVILRLANAIPENPVDGPSRGKALGQNEFSTSVVTELLKLIFFRLANYLYNPLDFESRYLNEDLHIHDQFILHLVEGVSHSNPEMLSSLLSGSCVSAKTIKEALYQSAIREKNYTIVSGLLKAGVHPDLPVRIHRHVYGTIRRGIINGFWDFRWLTLTGMQEAAFSCDTRLGEILLQAGADINNTYSTTNSPLAIAAYAGKCADKADDAVDFARLLVKHGALVNLPAVRCQCQGPRGFSPLPVAIVRGNNGLPEFLVEKAEEEVPIEYCGVEHRHCHRNTYLSSRSPVFVDLEISWTPLQLAIIAQNKEITKRYLQPILSCPRQTPTNVIKELLLVACLAGDIIIASKLLMLDVELNNDWSLGITPLVATAWNPDISIAEMLLKLGAHIGPRQRSMPAPIHVAAHHGNTDLVRLLISRGASCNIRYIAPPPINNRGTIQYHLDWLVSPFYSSPLQLALSRGNTSTAMVLVPHSEMIGGELAQATDLGDSTLITHVFDFGADVLSVDKDGRTALEAAAKAGNESIISLYFSSGGKYRSKSLYIATEIAIKSRDHSIVRLLAKHRPPGEIDGNEASCLALCLIENDWDLAQLFLEDRFTPGHPRPMHYRSYNKDSTSGWSDLCGFIPLSAAFYSGNVSIVESMIRRGYTPQPTDIEILMRDESGPSLILNTIRTLFWSEFPLESMSPLCHQAFLIEAIKSRDLQRARDSIELLDSVNFIVWTPDRPNLIPLKLAVQDGQEELVCLLLDAGADTEFQKERTSTALQAAALDGHLNIVKLLLDRGALLNPPIRLRQGATALQYAAIGGHLSVARFLIERQANINELPAKCRGRTALEGAAEHGRLDMIQLFLEMGARLDEEMRVYYVRSVGFAMKEGHFSIANYLKQCGSWGERDQLLHDRPGVLEENDVYFRYDRESDDWHIRWMKYRGDDDWYSVGSSEDSLPDARDASGGFEEAEGIAYDNDELSSVDCATDCISPSWWDCIDFSPAEPNDPNPSNRGTMGYGIMSPCTSANNGVIIELDDNSNRDDIAQEAATSSSLEIDCQIPSFDAGSDYANKSMVGGHAATRRDTWEQVTTIREEVPYLESTGCVLKKDVVDGQNMPLRFDETGWERFFPLSTDGFYDVNDIE
ncbi:ankyrin repeat-containing domain protein [Nemania abortiva]|nr:ankyrin repeat-containing domain protein [Nemania abortiva]